jgi:small subunit ribosomal protein S1
MKQLIPTGLDEYIAEHKVGDKVSGRVVTESPAVIELGEGIRVACTATNTASSPKSESTAPAKADLSSLSSMLQARWKGNAPAGGNQPEPLQTGQLRTFKITKLDPTAKAIEVELA